MSDPTPLYTEAERYLSDRDLDRAAELFHRGRALEGPHAPIGTLGLARVAILLGRLDQADALLHEVLARHPQHALGLTLQGVVEEARGNHAGALRCFTDALAQEPRLGLAHYNRARVLAQQTRWREAAAAFEHAVDEGVDAADARVQWGIALVRAGRLGDALRVLTEAVRLEPCDLTAAVTLADALTEAGRLDLADAVLANAQTRFPGAALPCSKRAALALRQRDLEGARQEAWRVTELAPADEEAWLFAAILDSMCLRFDGAERALKQALRLNPRSWRAHYHLGGLFDALRQDQAARQAYRKAIECGPNAWQPHNNLATLLLEDGTRAALVEARALLERAAHLGTAAEAATVRYNLALVCFKLGDGAGVRRATRDLARIAPPEHPLAAEVRRLGRLAA